MGQREAFQPLHVLLLRAIARAHSVQVPGHPGLPGQFRAAAVGRVTFVQCPGGRGKVFCYVILHAASRPDEVKPGS